MTLKDLKEQIQLFEELHGEDVEVRCNGVKVERVMLNVVDGRRTMALRGKDETPWPVETRRIVESLQHYRGFVG